MVCPSSIWCGFRPTPAGARAVTSPACNGVRDAEPPLSQSRAQGSDMKVENSNAGQKGRLYLTKHIWVPQEPIENFNLRMSDMILRCMPKLPLGGEDALRA